MNSITNLSPAQLRKAATLQEKVQKLQTKLGQLLPPRFRDSDGDFPHGHVLRRAANIQDKVQKLRTKLGNILRDDDIPFPLGKPKKRKMSAAGLKNIRAAQKARWAKSKANKGKPVKKARRKMGVAGRAALSAAAKARWAKVKKAGKSRL